MVKYDFSNCRCSQEKIEATCGMLSGRFEQLREVASKPSLASHDDIFAIPSMSQFAIEARDFAVKHSKLDLLVIVGIGGSSLGAKAVIEALFGKYYNMQSKRQVLFAETCDPESMKAITEVVKAGILAGESVLVLGISKSGTTTETIANFELLQQAIVECNVDPRDHMAVITDEDSKFGAIAEKLGFDKIISPKMVGGRYSIFTTVGLVPLALMGVDIDRLLEGAQAATLDNLSVDIFESPAAVSASTIYMHFRQGRSIFDQFMFSPELESCGKWYRQLLAESSGKEWNVDESAKVNAGIMPTVSIGTTDLHSIAQLYLAGPGSTYFRFVSCDPKGDALRVPQIPEYEELVQNIQGRDTQQLMDAILGGVKSAFTEANLPFQELRLKSKSTKSLGWMFQFEMIEVVMLCHLLGVNPYDQPNVEQYKSQTRRILSQMP